MELKAFMGIIIVTVLVPEQNFIPYQTVAASSFEDGTIIVS
jgi:hypothetical protein